MMATSSNAGSVGLLPSSSFKEKSYIGLFKQNAAVSFEGAVEIHVLAGILQVEGRLITPSLSYHPLLSPLTSSRSVLTCVSSDTLVNPDLRVHLRHLKQTGEVVLVTRSKSKSGRIRLDLCDADISLINRVLSGHSWGNGQLCAVVLLKELKSALVDVLKNHFFSSDLVFPKNEECKLMNNFRILNSLTKSLTIPDTYKQIAAELTTASSPVVLVCGKKNTGKSTLCRFLINNLLNSNESVMFLECDVGQVEFTVAAVISLHCITCTVSGPAYSHLTTPTKAYFLGDTSPKLLSDYYVRLVRECMAYYRGNHGHTPLIVNTCGYTTGQGLQLLNELVSIVQPSQIIRLKKATPTATPLPNDEPPPSKIPKTENDLECEGEGEWFTGYKCNMHVVKVDRTGPVYTRAKYTRLLAYLSYFSPLLESLPPSANNETKRNFLLAVTPYEVPWSTVAVHAIHRKVPSNHLLYALNGKFVALGRVSDDEIIDHCDKYPGLTKFLKSSLPIVEYLGLGLIRGIDPLKKVFYVTTPESFDVLSMTNCLVLGNTEPPLEIISQGHMTTPCPYVLQCDSITTSSLERS